jgi:hypothetical protein
MPNVRRYSRVYWEAIDDPKFSDVWDDDARVGCWLRLLVAADMAHPASPTLPVGINRKVLDHLVSVGLVDLQGRSRYRIHGLDSERAMRSDQASSAAASRWDTGRDSGRSTDAMQTHSGRNAEGMPRREEEEKSIEDESPPNPRKRGLRSNGTNPRAIADQMTAGRKAALDALHLAYQRHEITEDEWKARASAVRGQA